MYPTWLTVRGSPEDALVAAAKSGKETVVRHLLAMPHGAPRADCNDGQALVRAARGAHNTT